MIHGSPQGRDLDQGLFMAAALDGDRVLRQSGQQEFWEEVQIPLNRQWETSAPRFKMFSASAI